MNSNFDLINRSDDESSFENIQKDDIFSPDCQINFPIYNGNWYTRYPSLTRYDERFHLFSAFNKNVIVILNYHWWPYPAHARVFDPEHLEIFIIYNNIYNAYFILAVHWGIMFR